MRTFSYRNRSFVEFIFIVTYTLEQIVLLLFTFTIRNINQLNFIISLFALIVITTFSVQKLALESRVRLLEKEVTDLQKEKSLMESSYNTVREDYNTLLLSSEDLNMSRTLKKNKRGVTNES